MEEGLQKENDEAKNLLLQRYTALSVYAIDIIQAHIT